MTALALDYAYRYLHPSELDSEAGALRLATFGQGDEPHPYFFRGQLVRPRQMARMLRGLMRVVQTQYHIPPAMLAKILRLADPVVTCSDDRLRFEAFSGCCGVYARIDLLPGAVSGETFGRGTTNVDFNQGMLSALAMIRDSDEVCLNVGSDEVALSRNQQAVVEKKVKLPIRWLKGFVEVQACQSRMQPRLEINGAEASRFLRSLPRMKTNRRTTWVVPAGRGLRLSQVESRGAVRIGGLERLRVLEDLADQARTLRVYADDVTGASAWELQFDDARFHLVISPEVWRGFSGEGQALETLASEEWKDSLTRVRATLKWQAVVDLEQLTSRFDLDGESAQRALTALGSRGLVGFDLGEGAFFHRELPFNLDEVERLQPRLTGARKLIAENKVQQANGAGGDPEFHVEGSGVQHRVRLIDDGGKCTCPWFAKHGNTRGPCKHILAAQIFLEQSEA